MGMYTLCNRKLLQFSKVAPSSAPDDQHLGYYYECCICFLFGFVTNQGIRKEFCSVIQFSFWFWIFSTFNVISYIDYQLYKLVIS